MGLLRKEVTSLINSGMIGQGLLSSTRPKERKWLLWREGFWPALCLAYVANHDVEYSQAEYRTLVSDTTDTYGPQGCY